MSSPHKATCRGVCMTLAPNTETGMVATASAAAHALMHSCSQVYQRLLKAYRQGIMDKYLKAYKKTTESYLYINPKHNIINTAAQISGTHLTLHPKHAAPME